MYVQTPYFDDSSLVRRVHREQTIAFAGGRALLMMAAHPVAFEGFFHSTGSLDDPYERLRRTGDVLDAITWGPRPAADRLTARVRAMHRAVTGELPVDAGRFARGTPYRAGDPELLLWVLAALADSSLLVYERYVAALTDAERDTYWQDFRLLGKLFGLPKKHSPRDIDAFDDYIATMLASGDLVVTPAARELGVDVVLNPPAPLAVRPLVEVFNFVTVGLLPGDLRRQYGLSWDPARALVLRGGAEYVRRVLLPLLPPRLRLVPSARAVA